MFETLLAGCYREAMFTTTAEFFAAAMPHIVAFDAWSERYAPDAQADHLCYKCVDADEFQAIRALFEHESLFVYQFIISKRRIAIIKFLQPLKTALGDVWFLELSDQKPDRSQASGFDHLEIYPRAGSMEELATTLAAKGMALENIGRAHHETFDGIIAGGFKIRLEPNALLEKIKETELS